MSSDALDFFERAYRKVRRYWVRENRHSTCPADFPSPWREFLTEIALRPPGSALDLGAGEGSDAIRLARLGYEVDAVEGTAAGAEKIEAFARQAGVRLNVIHADVRQFRPRRAYDVAICNGLLHYVVDEEKRRLVQMIQEATRAGGVNLVFLFSNHDPVPDCHRVIDVYCDTERGILQSLYHGWEHRVWLEHNKVDKSHVDFPLHGHSYIKILARNAVSQGG